MNEIENKLNSISNKINVPDCGQFTIPVIAKKRHNYKKIFAYGTALACVFIFYLSGIYKRIPLEGTKGFSAPIVTKGPMVTKAATVVNNGDQDITLNPLGENAGEGIGEIKLNCSKDNFEKSVPVYSVNASILSDEQIATILAKLGFVNAKVNTDQKVRTYLDKKGKLLMYNTESGTLEYMSERLQNGKSDEIIKKPLTKEQYIEKAKIFIKNLGFEEEMSVRTAGGAMFVEGFDDNNKPVKGMIRYEVAFVKNAVDGYEFDGVGPGIKLQFDASGKIISMLRVNRELTKLNSTVLTKNETEIGEAFANGHYSGFETDGGNGGIDIEDCKLVLFSDPAQMKQDYMVPFFVFTGKRLTDGSKVSVMMNALKENEYRENIVNSVETTQ